MKCKVCDKEIQYNENETCDECHQEILRRLAQKEGRIEKTLPSSIIFKVAGVTFKNEEGKDIQKEIKKILNEYKKMNIFYNGLYGGYTNSEIKEMDLNVSEYEGYTFPAKIVGDEYNGEDCFKIYFKTYNDEYVHVGYAPKNILNELTKNLTKEDVKVNGTLEVVGGKYKHCEIYEEDYQEKEKVTTEELAYGLEVELNFYDSNATVATSSNKKVYDEEMRKIETENMKINIIVFFVIAVVSVPFIWVFWNIIRFIGWLFD